MKIIFLILIYLLFFSCSRKECTDFVTFFNLDEDVRINVEKYNEVSIDNELLHLLLDYNANSKETQKKLVSLNVCKTDQKEWMGVTNDISIIFEYGAKKLSYGVWTTKDSFVFFDYKQKEYFEIIK
jgi:hypothetical protein